MGSLWLEPKGCLQRGATLEGQSRRSKGKGKAGVEQTKGAGRGVEPGLGVGVMARPMRARTKRERASERAANATDCFAGPDERALHYSPAPCPPGISPQKKVKVAAIYPPVCRPSVPSVRRARRSSVSALELLLLLWPVVRQSFVPPRCLPSFRFPESFLRA